MSTFDDLVEHEKKTIVNAASSSARRIYHPMSTSSTRRRYEELRNAPVVRGLIGSLFGVGVMATAGAAIGANAADAVGVAVGITGSVVSLVAGVRYDNKHIRALREFNAAHPNLFLWLPSRAADAWDAWAIANRKLLAMDVSDETRQALSETSTVMGDLAVAAAKVHEQGVADGAAGVRVLDEMVRHAAETRALLGIALEREQLIAGINVDALMARATRTSITGAADTVAADLRELATILDGPTHIGQLDQLDAGLAAAEQHPYALEARS